jgi:hypothetical protein
MSFLIYEVRAIAVQTLKAGSSRGDSCESTP